MGRTTKSFTITFLYTSTAPKSSLPITDGIKSSFPVAAIRSCENDHHPVCPLCRDCRNCMSIVWQARNGRPFRQLSAAAKNSHGILNLDSFRTLIVGHMLVFIAPFAAVNERQSCERIRSQHRQLRGSACVPLDSRSHTHRLDQVRSHNCGVSPSIALHVCARVYRAFAHVPADFAVGSDTICRNQTRN